MYQIRMDSGQKTIRKYKNMLENSLLEEAVLSTDSLGFVGREEARIIDDNRW